MMDNPQQSSIPESKTSISEDPLTSPEQVYPEQGRRVEGSSAKSPYGKKNWKKWIFVYIIIAAIIYGGVYYFFLQKQRQSPYTPDYQTPTVSQPTSLPDPTANWKMYKQGEIWEIRYPENWTILEDGAITTSSVGFSDGKDVPRGPVVGYIYVQVAWGSTSSYDGLLAKEVGSIEKGSKLTTAILEKLTVGGYPAVKQLEETAKGAATEYSYEIAVYVKGPINVRISALSLKDRDVFTKTYLPIFDQILSTFKFLDQEQTEQSKIETVVLQDDYAFTIELPVGFSYLNTRIGDQVGYVYAETGEPVVRFLISSGGGESSPKGATIIDGVAFTIDYRESIGCNADLYPTNAKYPGPNNLYFQIMTARCESNLRDLKMEGIIQSIRFSNKLKDLLLGKTEAPPLE